MRAGKQDMVDRGQDVVPNVFDPVAGAARLQDEADRLRAMLAAAVPPGPLAAAPSAPARGPMQLLENWIVEKGGTRSRDGAHMRDMIQPEIMVEQARQRHALRSAALGDDAPPFLAPFTPGQIAVARAYRDLVEWRAGSGMKCASVETGRGGGGAGSGLFIDGYIAQGDWLDRLRARIGAVCILDVRRHMDRGNSRRPITARVAVDALVIEGMDLSAILKNHRWQVDGKNRKALRMGICRALDRMQGHGEK